MRKMLSFLKISVATTFLIALHCLPAQSFAQSLCPPNIDFEQGDFTNWQCYTGTTSLSGGNNVINVTPSVPTTGRHTILGPSYAGQNDQYGQFPVLCPNGSNYTVKLGNNGTGSQAERISYTFTIPANVGLFSLVYNYAVVFEDPSHPLAEQPRFIARVFDVATNNYVGCSTFEFVATSNLPGFTRSPINSSVWYKSWTPVTINLSGMAGRTIRVEFTTADCTRGGHFGYAYVDVNTSCASPVLGAFYCPGAASTTLTAPYGYQTYTWYNNTFTQQLGTGQTLTMSPPPPTNSVVAVEIIPYQGFGCKDTIYATINQAQAPTAVAGSPLALCPGGTGQLGTTPIPGNTYSWAPATGLSSPTISDPVFTAINTSSTTNTNYVLTVTDPNTGCSKRDTVVVTNYAKPSASFNVNSLAQCINNNSVVITHNNPSNYTYSWNFGDASSDNTSNPPPHVYASTGSFPISLNVISPEGCTNNSTQTVVINGQPAAVAGSPLNLCPGSTGQLGVAPTTGNNYSWSPSTNLSSSSVSNPIVTGPNLSTPQTISYVLTVTNASGCAKNDTVLVNLSPNPSAAFTINNVNQCIDNNSYIFTNNNSPNANYTWNFGDNTNSNAHSPAPHHYATDNTYEVMLVAVSGPGCTDTVRQNVIVHPLPANTLTFNSNIICDGIPVPIKAMPGLTAYNWFYNGIALSTPHDSVFNALQGGTYTVELTSQYGCKNTSTPVTLNLVKKPVTDFAYEKYCVGLPTNFINRTNTTGSGTVDYFWKFGNTDSSFFADPTVVYNKPGLYKVQLTTIPQQCPQIATTKERTILIDIPKKAANYTPVNAIAGKPLMLQARNFGVDYQWSPNTYLTSNITPSSFFIGNKEQQYTVKITAASGCVTVDTLLVRMFKDVEIYVPKGFTPNGDGQNEKMYPFLVGIQQLKYFRIINRWGVVVYQSANDLPGWDGTYKGQAQPMDGYVWEAEAIDIYGNVVKRSGNFTLIR
jgi:gliding motility-associated-like protein